MSEHISTQNIIRKETERLGGDFDRVYAYLHQEVSAGRKKILRHGNTLLLCTPKKNKTIEAHFVTVDKPKAIISAAKKFHVELRKAGVKKVVSNTDDKQIIRLLESGGFDVKATPVDGGYHLEFEV